MQGGLHKLAEAAATVDTLTHDAAKQREQLSAKQREVDHAMSEIQAAMEAAGSRKSEVEVLAEQQAQEQQAVSTRSVRNFLACNVRDTQ